jgi:xylulokinase
LRRSDRSGAGTGPRRRQPFQGASSAEDTRVCHGPRTAAGHSEQERGSGRRPWRGRRRPQSARVAARRVVAIGVSGQQHGFVPLDARGTPIRPAKLWNDTSTVEETEALVEALGGTKAYIRKLGINLAVGFTASKILWLKRHEPTRFRRLATVLLPHNYLNFHLTGVAHMEYGDASGTGLWMSGASAGGGVA